MPYKTIARVLPAAVMLVAGSATFAAAASDAIAARQAHYKELGKAFKLINDQLKSSAPDLAVIRPNAATVTRLARQQNSEIWFPAGTQAGQGLQTAAKPAIWANGADFNAKRAALAKASANYAAVAGKGDIEAIKAATAAVGQTCKA